jgi:Ca2+-binding RTX toxin-like protein
VDIGFKGNFGATGGIEVIDASGATGNVRLLGDSGTQTLDFRTVTLTGTRLVIDAGNGNDVVYGSAGADTLVSHNGEDTVDGAGGSDTYRVTGNTTTGFHGYDTYKDSGTAGTDKIVALGTGDVDIGLLGSFGAGSGIEAIDASGATGNVRLLGDNSASTLDFRTVTLTGTRLVIDASNGNDTVYGSAGNDTLVSNHGEDLLDGAGGSDTYRVTGNAAATFHGRDTYKDSGTSGTDTVMALGAGDVDIGVHDWQGTGIEVVDGTGAAGRVRLWANDSANLLDFSTTTFVGSNILIDGAYGSDTIKGSAGNDVILGGADADLLDGQDGSDTYRVTGNRAAGWNSFHHFDLYADTGTTGTDKIVALGTGDVDIGVAGWQNTGIEVVDATGATGLVRLLGRDEADVMDFRTTTLVGANLVIDGGYSNDTIFGSAGADTIIGAGNDDLVDGAEEGDTFRVTGNVAGGWSSFQGYDTYSDTGTTGIDRLVALGGAVDIGLAGWQNTGVETIDATGATGTVRLLGGDDATLFDFSTTTLTGSNLLIDGAWGSDTLVGSAAADQIVGGGGDDRLDGFEGSDTYQVTGNQAEGWRSFQGFDTYQDTGTTGIDTLHAQGAGDVDIGLLNFDVSSGIEVIDTRDVVGQTRIVGSWSDDVLDFSGTSILGSRVVIDGSGGTDVVFGSAGDDTIIGGSGADSMAGGTGNDVYRVGRGASLDVIWDYDETAGNQDVIEFGPDIAIDQLWFQRLDGFLEVSVIGSWDRVYVMDWDTGPASQVEQFRTADGHVLLNTQVDTLISAMAAFDAPSGGTTTLPEAYRAALVPLITSTWS